MSRSRLLHLIQPRHIHLYGKDVMDLLLHAGGFVRIWNKEDSAAASLESFMACQPGNPLQPGDMTFLKPINLNQHFSTQKHQKTVDRGPCLVQYLCMRSDVAVLAVSPYPNSQVYNPTLATWRKDMIIGKNAEKQLVRNVLNRQDMTPWICMPREAAEEAFQQIRLALETCHFCPLLTSITTKLREQGYATMSFCARNSAMKPADWSKLSKKAARRRTQSHHLRVRHVECIEHLSPHVLGSEERCSHDLVMVICVACTRQQ